MMDKKESPKEQLKQVQSEIQRLKAELDALAQRKDALEAQEKEQDRKEWESLKAHLRCYNDAHGTSFRLTHSIDWHNDCAESILDRELQRLRDSSSFELPL